MSFTHECVSQGDFWAIVGGAQDTHGKRWTWGNDHARPMSWGPLLPPPPWTIEVGLWGTPCILVDREKHMTTSFDPELTCHEWHTRQKAPGDFGRCFKCEREHVRGSALCKTCTVHTGESRAPPKPAPKPARRARKPKVLDARGTASVSSYFG